MSLEDQNTSLEEAISALREEIIKELAESITVTESFNDTFFDSKDYIWFYLSVSILSKCISSSSFVRLVII